MKNSIKHTKDLLILSMVFILSSVFSNIQANNINSEDIYNQILFYGCDTIVASPILIDKLSKYLLNDKIVKRIFMGGSAVLPNKIIEYKKIKDIDINIIYGASEAEPISECNIKEINKKKIFDKEKYKH